MSAWTYVDLADDQVELIREAERTLPTDLVLAFRSVEDDAEDGLEGADLAPGLPPAPLTDSQLDCLQGLESRFDAVLVAYATGAS